jgi:tyrosyl-tRNA synthetase
MKIITDEKKIEEVLDRGVLKEFLPTKKEFKERLMSGEQLRFYIGADPTAKALHLGHAQNLMLLEDFRKLGHQVIFLIGDFTGMIGDPGDKSSARVKQTPEEVQENFKGWVEQTKNILSFEAEENPVLVKYNSEWLGKLTFAEVLELASNFTVQQMLERDMFEKRMEKGTPIYVHEFMYPLMQGYDSVAMEVDVEMCGTDQIFNALAGRTLLQKLKGKEKFVIATNLIADEKTGQLMSKSNGTGVFLDLSPQDLFGAIMAQTDGMIRPLAIGCTRLSLQEIEEMTKMENPRDAKLKLAFEITRIFHGENEAQKAQEYFVNTFSKKEISLDDMEELKVAVGDRLIDVLVKAKLAESNADAKRKIKQGGVSVDSKKIADISMAVTAEVDSKILKVGKKEFRKMVISN